MLLQLIDHLVPERTFPVDEEVVYNGTSTNVSRRRAWASDTNKRLNGLCHKLDVFLSAVWSIDVLHNNESDGPVDGGDRESVVNSRDPHSGLWLGIETLCNPILG